MKFMSVFLLVASAALAGCSTVANNGTNANIRGTNTNTGYVTNSETNVKPAMPVHATNISSPSMNTVTGNKNTNYNSTSLSSNTKSGSTTWSP